MESGLLHIEFNRKEQTLRSLEDFKEFHGDGITSYQMFKEGTNYALRLETYRTSSEPELLPRKFQMKYQTLRFA